MAGEQDDKTKGTETATPADPAAATAAAEAEYDKTWEEAEKAETGEKPGEAVDPPPAEKKEGDDTTGLPEKAPIEEETPTAADDKHPHGTDVKALEKALADTKTAFTRVSQEAAELRRQVEAARRGDGDAEALEEAKRKAADARDNFDALKTKLLEDYPELEGFLDITAKEIRGLRQDVTELRKGKEKDAEAEARKGALDKFNAKVKPSILEEHKDFDAIMGDEEYWKWAEKQRPALRFAALDSPDSEDIKGAIREYKRFKATPEAQRVKEEQDKTKRERLRNAQSLRPGAPPLAPKGPGKKDDYDTGWDEAGRELEKEGVRVR